MAGVLVTDTWGTNLNPVPKTFKMAKLFTVTPVASGTPLTQTVNFFNKDCPFNVDVLNIKAISQALTTAHFNGTGGAIGVTIQRSNEVDSQPASPSTPGWDALLSSIECKDKATDALCFDAPGDGTNVLDQDFVSIPKGGSLRGVLSAQIEDVYVGGGSAVSILVIVECRPTNLREQRYF
jgi:hypothetical protein